MSAPDPPPADQPAPRVVSLAVRCNSCGYELSGLESDQRCPECGVHSDLLLRITDADPANLRCIACQYQLAAIDPKGVCPECGTAVEVSRQRDALAFASLAYLESIHLGARMVRASLLAPIVILIVLIVLAVVAKFAVPFPIVSIAYFACWFAALAGWCFLAASDDRLVKRERPNSARRWTQRSAIVAGTVLAPAALMMLVAPADPLVVRVPLFQICLLGAIAATAAVFLFGSVHIRVLARRLDQRRIAHRALRTTVVLTICAIALIPGLLTTFYPLSSSAAIIGSVIAFFGVLVAILQMLLLMLRLRDALGVVIADKKRRQATAPTRS